MASVVSGSAASPSVSESVASASTIPASTGSMDDPLTIQFTTVQDLFAVIACASGDFLSFTGVSPSSFAEIQRERERRGRRFRLRRYEHDRQTLFVAILTLIHESLHLELFRSFLRQLDESQDKTWKLIGATTLRAQGQGHPAGDEGEGDSTGGPRPERSSKGCWPTLVIEASVSQSLGGLHNGMRWWFSASDHQVQIVLLAKLEQEEPSTTRPGAMTTRNAAALQPVLRQTITITPDTTTNPISFNVTSGALGGFVLSVQELENYAQIVWEGL
ncbi:hypothetical protein C8A05DRAFT_43917 [Staphylotrichum tortipilum]|uniref:Uncharacterized protein n=1 Tax=Staphylotrichum tortipilum TaxID=2831512 RepID=A0AAN6MKS5_9PEZI|nr:hypothetical protein C8A05DRAFT_43917 [Staphylotrichum longicolle]